MSKKTQELDIWADQSNLPVTIEDVVAGKKLDVLLLDREKINMIIAHVEGIAKSEVYDVETVEGRKRMIKAAGDVSSSKTLFKVPFADRIRDVKAQPKVMTENNAWFNSEMDRIRDEIKAPAVAWQDEKDRISAEKQAVIDQFANCIAQIKEQLPVMDIMKRAGHVQSAIDWMLSVDIRSADDRLEEAQTAKADCLQALEGFLAYAEKEISQAEQVEKDRVAAIQAQAKIDAQAEVAREIQQAKIDKEEAELRAKQAQENTERQVALAASQAEEKAKRDQQIEESKKAHAEEEAAEAERKRSEDEAHMKQVRNDTGRALMGLGLTKEQAAQVMKDAYEGNLFGLKMFF